VFISGDVSPEDVFRRFVSSLGAVLGDIDN
jgi:hypothetical protein